MSAAAEIAQKYVKAHGADRKKDGGSRGGSGVSDSRTTVGVGSSGSDRNMFCVYCKKVGHRELDCCKWKADENLSVKVIVTRPSCLVKLNLVSLSCMVLLRQNHTHPDSGLLLMEGRSAV